jgi:hypothetical protein
MATRLAIPRLCPQYGADFMLDFDFEAVKLAVNSFKHLLPYLSDPGNRFLEGSLSAVSFELARNFGQMINETNVLVYNVIGHRCCKVCSSLLTHEL